MSGIAATPIPTSSVRARGRRAASVAAALLALGAGVGCGSSGDEPVREAQNRSVDTGTVQKVTVVTPAQPATGAAPQADTTAASPSTPGTVTGSAIAGESPVTPEGDPAVCVEVNDTQKCDRRP